MTSELAELEAVVEGPRTEADNHAARGARLSLGALSVYGSGALVENLTSAAIGGLLFFYLNVVCGLSAGLAGLALGLTLIVDASFDPVMGSISDNSRSPRGRRHPYMIASILPIVALFGLLFSIPHSLKGWPLFGYALAILFSLRVAVSLFYVPYMALGAELTDDYAERSRVVSWRVLFTVIGGIAAAYLAWGVFLKGDGRYHSAAYIPLVWTFVAIVLFGAVLSTFGTLGSRDRLHAAPTGQRFGATQFLKEMGEVLRNRSFISLFMPCLILFTALGVAGTLTLHANSFFWKLTSGQILFLQAVVAPVGIFLGLFLAAALARRIEKRATAVLGLAMIGVAQLAPVTLRLAGIIPTAAALPTLATAGLLGGLGGSIATIAFQSMMADAADEHEYLFGARREGLYFAGITFSAKASSGLGAAIGGLATQLIGFPAGVTDPAAIAKIPVSVIHNLAIAYGPGASIFTAISLSVLLTYRLTKADYDRIQDELKSRRAAKAEG